MPSSFVQLKNILARYLESFWLQVCVIVATLALGAAFAPATLRFDVADPAATRYLSGFSAAESNERERFRWSERDAALRLFGLTRRPLIAEIRMVSPRPPDAPVADTVIALGGRHTNSFIISGDWRRYMLLLPPRNGAPDARLAIQTFRPAKTGDSRRLGAALSQVAIHPADGLPAPLGAVATLGSIRSLIITLAPLALAASLARRRAGPLAWLIVLPAALLAAAAFARPIDTVAFLPDFWLIPLGTAVIALLLLSAPPRLMALTQTLQYLLASDNARLSIVLLAASLQGMLYLFMTPHWDHPDEAAHFEYAWLLAFHPTWPVLGTVNPEIAAVGGGGRALSHPPTYHLLVSLPLRLARDLDPVSQMYLARGVSFLFFLATIAIIGGMARALTGSGHPLRWLTPLVAALIPAFADTMISINNDVGAIAAFSLFLWGGATAIAAGLTARRAAWIIGAALLAGAMKNTALIAAPLAPVICLIALGVRRGWSRRAIGVSAAVAIGAALVGGAALALAWGDPAGWYRYDALQNAPARINSAQAVDGNYALHLIANPTRREQHSGLATPIAADALPSIAGNQLTIGAWVWASRPAQIDGVGVLYTRGAEITGGEVTTPQIDVGTEPRFYAWTFAAPATLSSLQLYIPSPPVGEPPVEIYVDGIIAAAGAFPAIAPQPVASNLARVIWNGQEVINLARNPSAEDAWPYVRPAAERALLPIVRQSSARIVSSLFDLGRIGPVALAMIPESLSRLFASFGSIGDITLGATGWPIFFTVMTFLMLLGCLWRIRSARLEDPRVIATIVIALVGALVWGNAWIRFLPMLLAPMPFFPRYGFPAIGALALALALGWMAFWPARRRAIAAAALVVGLVMLNLATYMMLWMRWYV